MLGTLHDELPTPHKCKYQCDSSVITRVTTAALSPGEGWNTEARLEGVQVPDSGVFGRSTDGKLRFCSAATLLKE